MVLPFLAVGFAFGAAGVSLLLKRRAWCISPAGLGAVLLIIIIIGAVSVNSLVQAANLP